MDHVSQTETFINSIKNELQKRLVFQAFIENRNPGLNYTEVKLIEVCPCGGNCNCTASQTKVKQYLKFKDNGL
jgi:hypothetical protein